MDLTVLTTLCIAFSSILINQTPLISSSSHDHGQHVPELAQTKLPRKMRPFEEDHSMKGYEAKDLKQDNTLDVALLGKIQSPHMVDGRRGSRQRWMEAHAWQYFTMDYAHVRRRRPIHNKSVPVGP